MNETKFEIIVNTKNKLTNEEINEILSSFKWRLEGYSTECPKSMIGAESIIQIKK